MENLEDTFTYCVRSGFVKRTILSTWCRKHIPKSSDFSGLDALVDSVALAAPTVTALNTEGCPRQDSTSE